MVVSVFKDFSTTQVSVNLAKQDICLKHVIGLGPDLPEGAISFTSLMSQGAPVIGNPPVGSDPFLLLYTSGTTSNPKGVPLTYQNMLGHARLCAPEFGMTSEDRILSVAPLSHLYGLYNYHCSLFAGAAVILLPAFSPPDMVKLVEITKTTAIFMGPAHAAAYSSTDLLADHDISSVKYTVFSGAFCPPDLLRWLLQQTGSGICQLWGMTELASGTFSRPGMDIEVALHSAGPASPGNEIRVVSGDNRESVSAGKEGELEVRGSSVFPGYLDNPEANLSSFADSGWFRTGDLAKRDDNGNYRITGRTKDLINRGGIKINPTDVEAIIDKHPAVFMSAIAPIEDKTYGAIQGLILSYDDPYSTFLSPEDSSVYSETIFGEFGGIGAELAFPNNPGYVASKGGLNALTRSLALDYSKKKIDF